MSCYVSSSLVVSRQSNSGYCRLLLVYFSRVFVTVQASYSVAVNVWTPLWDAI